MIASPLLPAGSAERRVIVATPLGEGGRGGIDRVMDAIRAELRTRPREGFKVSFQTTRGSTLLASPFYLTIFVAKILCSRALRRADVVHVNLSANASTYRKMIVATAAHLLGIPYIIHLHSGEFDTFWDSANDVLRRRIDLMFCKASRIIVLGTVWRDMVVSHVPNVRERIVILPNATKSKKRNRPTGQTLHVIFLGKLAAAKGVPELVEALYRLQDNESWRATLAGDGDVKQTRELVRSLGLEARIAVPGWVGEDGVDALLKSADILVLPSHVENLPMCLVEAFSYGVAVISTPVGAIPEIVTDGRTGLLIRPGEVVELVGALDRLLGDPGLRSRLGSNAYAEHGSRLEIGRYVDRLTSIWAEAARS